MSKSPSKPPKPPVKPASPGGPDPRITHWLLAIICFFAGAAVMIIEISANRLLAPHFGNSIYTWTALIGVVLVALSAGAWLGGILADRLGRIDLLGWLLAGAAGLTMLIPALNQMLAPSLSQGGLISGPVIISVGLFALPAVLVGAVSPASIRFYSMVNQDKQVGHAAGIISMLGSLGSFVGTFISGFFLLSAFGVTSIFLGTGLLLMVLALMAFWMARSPAPTQAKAASLCILAAGLGSQVHAAADARVIHQRNSFYHQIEVTEHGLGSDEQRFLKLDSTMEGGMRVHDGALVLDYQNFWRLAELHDDLKLERALFIGAGAFGMPEELSRMHPAAHVDVVEIDPAVIEVGRKFFKLDEHPSVHAHADDARRFLRRSSGGYDLIFGDAYNGVRHIPAHLVTKEFFQEVKAKLSARGVFLMNVITAVNGDKAELLGHMLATLRSVFPHLEVFAVSGAGSEPQNIILLASNETWKPWLEDKFYLPGTPQAGLAGRRIFERQLPAGGRVFTDDWNPVDAVIARQLLVK